MKKLDSKILLIGVAADAHPLIESIKKQHGEVVVIDPKDADKLPELGPMLEKSRIPDPIPILPTPELKEAYIFEEKPNYINGKKLPKRKRKK